MKMSQLYQMSIKILIILLTIKTVESFNKKKYTDTNNLSSLKGNMFRKIFSN